jgi:homoaconitate hydratase family protein/3-isopropylmalate dehydratase small subunit
MGKTTIEKIIAAHAGRPVVPGDFVDMSIDARLARDFGGANVVKNLEENDLTIQDPERTYFTFDCNPGGSSQKYAVNQQICRRFARDNSIKIYDINAGIGTHIAMDEGLVCPGETLVSTDSHANIVGALGAFGQGMGDQDIAYAFTTGKVWFKVPLTVRINLKGDPSPHAAPKDVILAVIKKLGPNGLLGYASEFYGDYIQTIGLSGRITIASMNTEMGGICGFIPPNDEVLSYSKSVCGREFSPLFADSDAEYEKDLEISIDNLLPQISLPGNPDNVVPVSEIAGKKIDSAFIGSCTNGRYEDLVLAAEIIMNRKIAPGVVLKIVPATDKIWQRALEEGILTIFKDAGALVGNAGCAGCAEGQIGQNGPGEITVSTGNRNFPGKQGQGEVFLSSPATAAASALAGHITTVDSIPDNPMLFTAARSKDQKKLKEKVKQEHKPSRIRGRVWIIDKDNIDTDMIYHNRYLTVTDMNKMAQFAFSNLDGWKDFPQRAKPGDVIITGKNFGCGSSRQQAVDCFRALGINLIIAESFGAIYERNAINSGFPIMAASQIKKLDLKNGSEVEVDFLSGEIKNLETGKIIHSPPFSEIQLEIYNRGGLLK